MSPCEGARLEFIIDLATQYLEVDWDRLRAALEFEHIHIPGNKGDLGVFEFCIPRRDAAHARQVIERTIRAGSLTVRVTKNAVDPQVYEVYEEGKKVREESYTIKQGAQRTASSGCRDDAWVCN